MDHQVRIQLYSEMALQSQNELYFWLVNIERLLNPNPLFQECIFFVLAIWQQIGLYMSFKMV